VKICVKNKGCGYKDWAQDGPERWGILIWLSGSANWCGRTSINYFSYFVPPLSLRDYKHRMKYSNCS